MRIRELLQTEIWSKETSRKILRRTWKIVKPAAVVSGILVLLVGVVFAVEWYWLTSGERRAGRVALPQIEELEKLVDCNCDQFSTVEIRAKAAVEDANRRAWTLRDHVVANGLLFYRMEIEQKQAEDVREAQLKVLIQQKHLKWHSNPKLDEEERSLNLQIFNTIRSGLHRELD